MRFIDPFFVKKDSSVPRPHMKRQNSLRKFIFAKILYSRKTCVGVVVDYADTMANFDGLRLTLKEQSARLKYLGVFPYTIATF